MDNSLETAPPPFEDILDEALTALYNFPYGATEAQIESIVAPLPSWAADLPKALAALLTIEVEGTPLAVKVEELYFPARDLGKLPYTGVWEALEAYARDNAHARED